MSGRDYCSTCQVVPPKWGDHCRLCTVGNTLERLIERLAKSMFALLLLGVETIAHER